MLSQKQQKWHAILSGVARRWLGKALCKWLWRERRDRSVKSGLTRTATAKSLATAVKVLQSLWHCIRVDQGAGGFTSDSKDP